MFSTKRRRAIAWAVIGMLAMGLLLLSLATIFRMGAVLDAVRVQQVESVQRGKDIQSTAHLIKDCTQPQGECFKRGQQRTANAVADINKISVYAAACADEPGTQTAPEIYSCVIARLAEDDKP